MQVEDGGAMNEEGNKQSIGFIATSSGLKKGSEDTPIKIGLDDWNSESITDVQKDESQPLPEKGN